MSLSDTPKKDNLTCYYIYAICLRLILGNRQTYSRKPISLSAKNVNPLRKPIHTRKPTISGTFQETVTNRYESRCTIHRQRSHKSALLNVGTCYAIAECIMDLLQALEFYGNLPGWIIREVLFGRFQVDPQTGEIWNISQDTDLALRLVDWKQAQTQQEKHQ
jgi:hypothetical protein